MMMMIIIIIIVLNNTTEHMTAMQIMNRTSKWPLMPNNFKLTDI